MRLDTVPPEVPLPPRGRRRPTAGEFRARVQSMRQAELSGGVGAMPGFLRDVILLLKDLAVDPRVPRRDKVVALCAAFYVVSPVDFVSDAIPVLGQLDDVGVVAYAAHRLLTGAGYETIYQLWRGSDQGLALLLTLAGVQE
jgi:uncharacterized membrane protein YkvA (DUF1232 family)